MHIVRIGGISTEQQSAETIGAKAANLARMRALGLLVPPAFVLRSSFALISSITMRTPNATCATD
jgi:hypothetical protein